MKKAKDILKHLFNPFNDKLQEKRCLKKIIALMPRKYNKYITSYSLKGEILYINVSHPALRQEIFYNKNIIFSIIKTLHKANQCNSINPKKIVTFYKYQKPLAPPKEIKFYIKEAGKFEIKTKKENLRKKFEEIKNLINSKPG
ncbi:DciA family protein [Lebetimonas sp. JH292]|uniref:DciA family protein n=1 Tax=Lebetimonas sp. JH292 TaxID=990068 RepID=UPI0004634991|nr:DciA family protein [Lebetimonas sp. JH292]